ncbi:GNAT family N-acetyltransferase [Streptomyces sp. NPDC052042]|uniref:GNAT family N-acetyltransferase n=1 Tax=Streptomyces sp. NPDC052042 TaxID=3365683 RepID=UPI0037D8C009
MEFTVGGRLEVRIAPTDVGKRVSVRRASAQGAQGPRFTDTVGVLTSWEHGVLSITTKSGDSVRIAESDLVAGKIVPAAPARRRGVPAVSFEELARVCARAWRPVESEALGGWELRAAQGFTRRANSVLPLGDPGAPLDEALRHVQRWYGERGLPAYIQVATGAEGTQERLGAALEERGWRREVTTEVRVGALAPVADLDADVARVRLSRDLDAAWLSRYQRFETPGAHVLEVLRGGPSVWFASVPADGPDEGGTAGAGGEDMAGAGAGDATGIAHGGTDRAGHSGTAGAGGTAGLPAAIGRCVVDGRWAGFMAVEVAPARRRRGLATAVMAALARRALEEGASAAWLQVEADNEAARALYDDMGFAVHHRYHHFRSA